MRSFIAFLLLACSSGVLGKNNVKSLTESLGQEVIEIGTPIKELPADMEEEPSIENEEDEHVTTSSVVTTNTKLTTKKEPKKTPAAVVVPRIPKKPNSLDTDEDEEERLEKELADIYKDNIEYKDSAETTLRAVTKLSQNSTADPAKQALRSNDRENFKFQPNSLNKAEVERFRTSVDDISCGKKLKAEENKPSSSYSLVLNFIIFNFSLLARILL